MPLSLLAALFAFPLKLAATDSEPEPITIESDPPRGHTVYVSLFER
jgi:hypothetical protein